MSSNQLTPGSKQKVVFVLGLPRSGSSVIMQLLSQLGLSLGDQSNLKQGDIHNPKGYFELLEVLEINESIIYDVIPKTAFKLLKEIGMSDEEIEISTKDWNWMACKSPISSGQTISANIQGRIRQIQNTFANSKDPIAVKDSRFSYTLPIWRQYFEPVCILLWRDPVEFSLSLSKASMIPHEFAMKLWSICLRAALQVTQGLPCLIIDHREILASPERTAGKIDQFLGYANIQTNHLTQQSSRVIESDLYRSKALSGGEIEKFDHDRNLLEWLKIGSSKNLAPQNESSSLDSLELLALIGALRYYHSHLSGLRPYAEDMKAHIEAMKTRIQQLEEIEQKYSNLRRRLLNIPGFHFLNQTLKRLGF